MAEVSGDAAERDHEIIVGERLVGEGDVARVEVDVFDLFEEDGDVGMIGEDGANWLRDVRRGETGGGGLIEERLGEVMILAIDQRDLRVGMAELLAKCQAAKSGAKDYDSRIRLLHYLPSRIFVFFSSRSARKLFRSAVNCFSSDSYASKSPFSRAFSNSPLMKISRSAIFDA